MSGIPTPLGSSRSGSRLPTSTSSLTSAGTSSLLKPPTVIGKTVKRPVSPDNDGTDAKRSKSNLLKSKSTYSQSMMHLPSVGSKAAQGPATLARSGAMKRPGIPPGKISGQRPATSSTATASRSAMGDRTNLARSNTTLSSTSSLKTPAATPASGSGGASKPGKRPAWDLKGRLEDIEAMLAKKQELASNLEQQNVVLQNEKAEKEKQVVMNSHDLDATKADLDAARAEIFCLKKEIESKVNENRQKDRQIEDLTYGKSSLERRLQEHIDELSAKQAELSGLKTTVSEITSASAGTEAKLKSCEMELEKAYAKIRELESLCADQKESIENLQEKDRANETERRKLHNTILELKGNIRVFCRLRPLLGHEREKFDPDIKHITVSGDKSLDIIRPTESPAGSTASGKVEKHSFEFDHVFSKDAQQEIVFEEISQLVQSAIDGYNVCIFAYGQTGSGKTFTMEGGDLEQQQGIIPRTIRKIYEETKNLAEKGWSYNMQASFLEIYNEEIRDLLATDKGLKYEIKKVDAKSNDIYVTNLKIEDVTNGQAINSLLNRAKKNRIVAATNCNERSSRSHSVFMLKISGVNSVTSEACIGTLNLVDLAGSERLKESGSTGLRLEETKNINSSLSNLSKVIMALASNKDGHIPYRDSKLTHLLMNSLGGNSKTLMFVNLSPREDFINETLNSLRFAKRVNQCTIGTATKKLVNNTAQ